MLTIKINKRTIYYMHLYTDQTNHNDDPNPVYTPHINHNVLHDLTRTLSDI
jgi:hypothetical protein